jgi:hypothetical protein
VRAGAGPVVRFAAGDRLAGVLLGVLYVLCARRVHNAGVPDVIVTPDEDDSPAADLAMQGAHDAAVAEGGAEVRAELATEAASEAEAAAAVALAVAEENAQTAAAVIEAQASAEGAAEESRSLAEMMRAEHEATRNMVSALAEEIRAQRESAKPPAEPAKTTHERPPGAGKPKWVRR